MKRLLLVACCAVLALLGAAGTASAHNVLISSNPQDGAKLDTSPRAVKLTFDQSVQDAGVNQVAVTGPDGGQWAQGPVRVDGTVVTAPLRPLGPAGEYVIGFRVVSADGHAVSEEIRFTLTKAGNGTPAPASSASQSPGGSGDSGNSAASQEDSGGIPVWVWVVAAVVLLGAGVAVALRMGSARDDEQ